MVPSDYTKADIPKLKADLQKWYPVMPASAKEWWETFLDGVGNDRDEGPHVQDIDCPIYTLKHHLQRPEAEEDEATEMDVLQNLRDKELAPLEEVNINLHQEITGGGGLILKLDL